LGRSAGLSDKEAAKGQTRMKIKRLLDLELLVRRNSEGEIFQLPSFLQGRLHVDGDSTW